MKINFYATLRAIVGKKTVEFDIPHGVSVREVVDAVIRAYPAMRRELLDDHGRLYQHVHVLVNGRDSPYLENQLDTPVSPEDTVNIFPAVGGG
jgi:molybdopterin synthase sulfur carrier subunit